MELTRIDQDRALRLLEAAIAERGADFVYNPDGLTDGCFYTPRPDLFDADSPKAACGCLIGEAARIGGADMTRLGGYVSNAASIDWPRVGLHLTGRAKAVWLIAQVQQDKGFSWGTVIEKVRDSIADGAPDKLVAARHLVDDDAYQE